MPPVDPIQAIQSAAGKAIPVKTDPTKPEQVHVFLQRDVEAIEAALGAKRPLLVRGEPGVGKSQLAQAAAVRMKRVFVQHVVDSRTEPRDLLWREDAVARLADAQLIAALGDAPTQLAIRKKVGDPTAYVEPGPLWWAFNWQEAARQAKRLNQQPPDQLEGDPANGAVVLIDEIDKADAEVPNGLLEALGSSRFTPRGWSAPITASDTTPLVVITTNEERVLPDAFVRRCVVHELELPPASAKEEDAQELLKRLFERGKEHFPNVDPEVLRTAARYLNEDRVAAEAKRHRPLPGQAEFLDLVRAAIAAPGLVGDGCEQNAWVGTKEQLARLDKLRAFFLQKHLGADR